jgi:diguanylate cyclase (GGDEF)-like protein
VGAEIPWERLVGSRLFRDVDRDAVQGSLERCALRRLTAGELLLDPNSPNDSLYLLLEGRLEVHLVGPVQPLLDVIEVGECAGELSVITGGQPAARVLSTVPGLCLAIPDDALWSMIGTSHALARNLLQILAERVRFGSRAVAQSRSRLAEVERSSIIDPLTELHNRRWLQEAFPREMRRCETAGVALSLLILDMDDFKTINDRLGHLMGDEVLRAAAAAIRERLRAHEMAARFGGDEFLVLLPEATVVQARAVADRLRQAIAAISLPKLATAGLVVSVSLGIAEMRVGDELSRLLERADTDLYRAKRGSAFRPRH